MVYLLLFLFEIIQFSPLKPTKWTMIFNSILHCSDWLWPWPSHHITSPLTAIYIQKWNSSMFLQKSLGHWRTTVISNKMARSLLEMLHQVKINQMCNTKFTERLCNYCKYVSHGELEDYFRLVWTPDFIASVIKEVTQHLKRNLQIKNGDLRAWVTWKALIILSLVQ